MAVVALWETFHWGCFSLGISFQFIAYFFIKIVTGQVSEMEDIREDNEESSEDETVKTNGKHEDMKDGSIANGWVYYHKKNLVPLHQFDKVVRNMNVHAFLEKQLQV